jgi:hypothetical protein
MTTRTRAAGLLATITMTAVLAACSSSDSGGGSDADSSTSSYDSESGASSGDLGTAESPSTGRDAAGSDDSTSSSAGGPSTPQMERAVVSTGTVSLSSTDVTKTRQDVQRIVDAQGGDITEEDTRTDEEGGASYSRFVIRVPSNRFSTAMAALQQVDGLVAAGRGSDDVSTEVIDTAARVRAQESSLERVELLLAESTSLKDLIWIESQLTTRQAELDSLKSQQSWLTDQTSLSTITVDITQKQAGEVVEPTKKKDEEPAGFLDGLSGGMKALGGTFAAIGLIVGALLPFAAVALVIGLPVWLVVRRRRATTAPVAPAETA